MQSALLDLAPLHGELAFALVTLRRGTAHVDIAAENPERTDEVVDDRVQVLDRRRMPQVELVPALLDDGLPVPLDKRRRRQLLCNRAVHADHLGFQPQSWHHAERPDPVQHRVEAAGKPGLGRGPRTHRVPPAFAQLGVPA